MDCLLFMNITGAGGNGNGLIWDPINLCWYLKINPPPGWVASKLTWESYFEKESLDILNKRITSIELSLSNGTGKDPFFYIIYMYKQLIPFMFSCNEDWLYVDYSYEQFVSASPLK